MSSSFMRSRMDSSTALELFSLGLRRKKNSNLAKTPFPQTQPRSPSPLPPTS